MSRKKVTGAELFAPFDLQLGNAKGIGATSDKNTAFVGAQNGSHRTNAIGLGG